MNSLNTRSTRSFAVLVAMLGWFASAASAQPDTLTNGVPITGISGSAGSEKFYKIEVPAGQDSLEISTSDGTGDVDLYVRRGAQPTTSSYDYRPYKIGNNETVAVENSAAGTWYIMLKGYNAYAGVRLLAQYSAATSITPLVNGVPVTGIGGAAGAEVYFSIDVPAGQTKLEIGMSGGTGDADLYVKRGALPTTTDYDYRPFLVGNNESVTVNNPAAATWYIMIRGYNAFSGITLLATYGGGLGTLLQNGVPVTNLSGAAGSEQIFRIEVPAGQTNLEIMISGGTGDVDLYVKYGSRPTQTDYDYRPYLPGNNETVTINTPPGGTWYIMLRGYANYTGVTLKASYGGVLMLQDGVPLQNLAGAAGSMTYYRIDVPSGQDVLLFAMSGGTGNADLYIKKGVQPTTSNWDYRPTTATNNESISIGGSSVPGTWYVMIRGTQAYSGVTLLADYSVSVTVVTLTNGVPVQGIAGNQGTARYFKIEVPAGQTKLEIAMSGGTGDADLYVRRGDLPTTSQYDFRPYLPGNNEVVTVNNPTAGTWYIMIRGYQAFSGVTLLATYGGGVIPDPDEVTELQNGVGVTGLAGSAGSEKFFKIVVPSGQAKLEIAMSGGTGDVDLYVRRGSKPTTSQWDYRPFLAGNNETVTIDNPTAGTWYIMLKGYTAYTGVSLKATYTPVPEEVTELQNGVPVTGLAGASGNEKFFKITVPAGQEFLKIEISGNNGDADLYVRRGSKPTLTSYDYRPYLIGSNESVEVENPSAGTWYIMIRGFQAYTGLTLKATYGVTLTGNNFASDPNAVAWWRFESGKLTQDSAGTHTLTNSGVTAVTEDMREGVSSGDFEKNDKDHLWIADENLSANFPLSGPTAPKAISVAFWMKLESQPPAGGSATPFSKFNGTTNLRSFAVMIDPFGQTVVLVGFNAGMNAEVLSAPTALQVGKWYHIAVTFNDSTKGYRISVWDAEAGVSLANKTGTSVQNVTITNADVFIGAREDLTNEHLFDGLLDEMVVFNDILTNDDIAQIRAGTYGKL